MVQLVCKISSRRITPSVAGSIPALAANNEENMNALNIPSIEKLLQDDMFAEFKSTFDHSFLVYCAREAIKLEKNKLLKDNIPDANEQFWIDSVYDFIKKLSEPGLKPVINGSGIIIHTNLGRSPLGPNVINDLAERVSGYSNLEFDLDKGRRGNRNYHLKAILKYVTGAEDSIAVNNNAAAVFLTLNTLAKDKEVIVSRGELVEIGGSFRIPEIMKLSGAEMVEIGTTNRTHLKDYENAINENTGAIIKVHQSNYHITGFTSDVELKELIKLGKKHNIPVIYDIGSGLLRKPESLPLEEPDVKSCIDAGADIVTFSCDKLLGGPQAGIISGKSECVKKIHSSQLMRTYRIGKLTISSLISVISNYFSEERLMENTPLFKLLNLADDDVKLKAENLKNTLRGENVNSDVTESYGRCGGGTLPDFKRNSYAVKLNINTRQTDSLFFDLLKLQKPILSVLREGTILIDVLCIDTKDFQYIADSVARILKVSLYDKNN